MSDDSSEVRRQQPGGSPPVRNPGARPAGALPEAGEVAGTGAGGVDGVVVVGGGAAGLAAAAAVRAAGVAVTLVSDGPLGGDCTWNGCVPSKSLLEAAAAGLGAHEALAHARAVVARVARGESEHALRAAGVRVLRARAVLDAGPVLDLDDGSTLRPTLGVVLATGSRPAPVAGAAGAGARDGGGPLVRDTDGWLDGLTEHLTGDGPRDVVVVGGGSSGVELAQALARLGAAGPAGTVTLLEQADDLLPGLPGAGPVLAAALARDGVRVVTGCGPARVRELTAPAGLVLARRGPDPGARRARARTPASGPTTARSPSTPPWPPAPPASPPPGTSSGVRPSTHVAVATGRVAAATLLRAAGLRATGRPDGPPATFDPAWVPRVVWTDPQVAAVGRVPGGPGTREVRVPLSRNDRSPAAAVPGRRDPGRGGSARVWVEGDEGGGRLVGAVLVGPQAGETVAEVALVGRLGPHGRGVGRRPRRARRAVGPPPLPRVVVDLVGGGGPAARPLTSRACAQQLPHTPSRASRARCSASPTTTTCSSFGG